MKQFRSRYLIVSIIFLLAVGGLYRAFGSRKMKVPTLTVSRGGLQTYVEDTGKVQAIDEATVSAPLGGQVEKLLVGVGDRVKRGQVVARLTQNERAIAEAGLARARERLAEARRMEELSRRLYESGAISENEYNRARMELKMAEVDLGVATAQYDTASKLGQTTLVAPLGGTVLEVLAKENQVLPPAAPVAVIGDPGRLEVRSELLAHEAVNVNPGQKAIISGPVLGDTQLEGVVRQVYPKAVTRISTLGLEQQRVPVIIDLVTPGGPLKPGFDVDVRIITGAREGVMALPKAAVLQKEGQSYVYVVENGIARTRVVKTGVETGEAVEITSGLVEGEVVVTNPRGEVSEGTRVVQGE